MIVKHLRHFYKKIKAIPSESWVVKPKDATKGFQDHDLSHLNIKFHREIKEDYSRMKEGEAVQPMSPVTGPMVVENPKIHDKIYRWCSCGQSLKQPFCDGSHHGTSFTPFKFTIEERVKDIQLCGCKLTSSKPFCDG
jgi:CDGSH iron-sulfur domain-containing protein 3